MAQNKIISHEEFCPTSLSSVKNRRGHDDFQILLIRQDLDREFGALKIMAPVLHGLDNGKHLEVMNVIIAFGRETFPGPERDRMQLAIIHLRYDTRQGCARRI